MKSEVGLVKTFFVKMWKGYDWWVFALMGFLPFVFLVLSYAIYIYGGHLYYLSYFGLALTIAVAATSVGMMLWKVCTLCADKMKGRAGSGFALWLVFGLLPILAVRIYLVTR